MITTSERRLNDVEAPLSDDIFDVEFKLGNTQLDKLFMEKKTKKEKRKTKQKQSRVKRETKLIGMFRAAMSDPGRAFDFNRDYLHKVFNAGTNLSLQRYIYIRALQALSWDPRIAATRTCVQELVAISTYWNICPNQFDAAYYKWYICGYAVTIKVPRAIQLQHYDFVVDPLDYKPRVIKTSLQEYLDSDTRFTEPTEYIGHGYGEDLIDRHRRILDHAKSNYDVFMFDEHKPMVCQCYKMRVIEYDISKVTRREVINEYWRINGQYSNHTCFKAMFLKTLCDYSSRELVGITQYAMDQGYIGHMYIPDDDFSDCPLEFVEFTVEEIKLFEKRYGVQATIDVFYYDYYDEPGSMADMEELQKFMFPKQTVEDFKRSLRFQGHMWEPNGTLEVDLDASSSSNSSASYLKVIPQDDIELQNLFLKSAPKENKGNIPKSNSDPGFLDRMDAQTKKYYDHLQAKFEKEQTEKSVPKPGWFSRVSEVFRSSYESLKKFGSNIASIPQDIKDLSGQAQDLMEEVQEQFKSLFGFRDTLYSVFQVMKNFFQSTLGILLIIAISVSLVLIFMYGMIDSQSGKQMVASALVIWSGCWSFVLTYGSIRSMVGSQQETSFWIGHGHDDARVSELFATTLKRIGGAVANVPITWINEVFTKDVQNALKNACLGMETVNKFTHFMDHIKAGWDWITDICHQYWYGCPKSVTQSELKLLFQHWLKISACPEKYPAFVFEHLKKVFTQAASTILRKEKSKLYYAIVNVLADIELKSQYAARSGFDQKRGCTPPFVLQIYGRAGIGKSTAIQAMAEAISKALFGCDISSVHTRNTALPYWEGYLNELICIIDDWGQIADSQANPSPDIMELIKINNIAPYFLDMAFEGKGKSQFTSPIVLLTSNKRMTAEMIKSVVEPKAVLRRIHIIIKATSVGNYVVEEMFGQPMDHPLDNTTLGPWILQQFEQFYTKELEVSRKVSLQFDDSLKNYQVGDWQSLDALHHFLRRTAHLTSDKYRLPADTKIEQYYLRNEQGKFVIRCSPGGPNQMPVGTATLGKEVDKKVFDLYLGSPDVPLSREAQVYQMPRKRYEHDPVIDYEFFTVVPSTFDLVKDRIKLQQVSMHRCEITGDPMLNSHSEQGSKDTITAAFHKLDSDTVLFLSDEDFCKGPACDNMPQHGACLPFCPFEIFRQFKVPKFELVPDIKSDSNSEYNLQAVLTDIVEHLYDCKCEKTKMCSRSHTFLFPLVTPTIVKKFVACSLRADIPEELLKKMNDEADLALNYSSRFDKWWNTKVLPVVKENGLAILATVGSVLAVIAGLFGAYALYRNYQKEEKQTVIEKHIELEGRSGDPKFAQAKKRELPVRAKNVTFIGNLFATKNMPNDQVCEQVTDNILNHLYKLRNNTRNVPVMNVLFLSTSDFLLTAHSRFAIQPDDIVEFCSDKGLVMQGMQVKFSELRTVFLKDIAFEREVDMFYGRLPEHFHIPGLSNINKKFCNLEDVLSIDDIRAVMVTMKKNEDRFIPAIYGIPNIEVIYKEISYSIKGRDDRVHVESLPTHISYAYGARPGDCTAVGCVVRPLAQHGRRIAWLHVAGSTSEAAGVGIIVTQEQLTDAKKRLDEQIASFNPARKLKTATEHQYIGNCFVEDILVSESRRDDVMCWYGESIYSNDPARTHLVETDIQKLGILPVTKIPAHIASFKKDGEWIDPNELALKKFAHKDVMLDSVLLELSMTDLKNKMRPLMDNIDGSTLTIEEAVFGVPGHKYLPSISVQTSGGLYWQTCYPGKGKKHLIDLDKKTIHPDLRAAVEERLRLAYKGVSLDAIFKDCMKDELRPIDKSNEGKTRLFSAGPVDLTIAMRMLFGKWGEFMMLNRNLNESSVGINPTSLEWDKLHKILTRFGDDEIAGDFKEYDGSQIQRLLYCIIILINWWYTCAGCHPRDNAARWALFRVVVGATHCNRGNLYSVLGCNSSGNPITVFINTEYDKLAVRYAYYYLARENKIDPVKYSFSENVSMVAYGDDNVINVSVQVKNWFNPESLTRALATIGLQYTDDAKKGSQILFRKIDEITYLKRGFKFDDELKIVIAPLDFDTILNVPNWTWDDIPHSDKGMSCEAVIRELSLYSQETFDKYSNLILDAARKCRYPFINASTRNAYRMSMLYGGWDSVMMEVL